MEVPIKPHGTALSTATNHAPAPLRRVQDCCEDCDPIGNAQRKPQACGCLSVAFISILLFALSWDTLEPTEYGLVVNGITGRVDTDPKNVYENGRYFVWLRHYFLRFPRNRVNLEFSATPPAAALGSTTSYSLPTIPARTGPDPDDRESGGQPVDLQVAFQYRFRKELVPRVYQTFGTAWEPSYMRFAQQAITNVAQQFTPKMFWDRRTVVEAAMHRAVNQSMFTNGFAEVPQLQLLQVGFKDNYEATITNIQLQEQLKVTKNYQLEVTRVLKEVDILLSQTDVRAPLPHFSPTPSLPAPSITPPSPYTPTRPSVSVLPNPNLPTHGLAPALTRPRVPPCLRRRKSR